MSSREHHGIGRPKAARRRQRRQRVIVVVRKARDGSWSGAWRALTTLPAMTRPVQPTEKRFLGTRHDFSLPKTAMSRLPRQLVIAGARKTQDPGLPFFVRPLAYEFQRPVMHSCRQRVLPLPERCVTGRGGNMEGFDDAPVHDPSRANHGRTRFRRDFSKPKIGQSRQPSPILEADVIQDKKTMSSGRICFARVDADFESQIPVQHIRDRR